MRPQFAWDFSDISALPERHQQAIEAQMAALSGGSRRTRVPAAKSTSKKVKSPPPLIPCSHEGCPGPCVEYTVYRFVWRGRPNTTNGNLKGQLRARMNAEREIHERVEAMLARNPVPTVAQAVIEVRGYLPNKGGAWDWDGTSLWVKAVQDALVTGGVLLTDTWRHALGGMQWAVAVDSDGPLRVEFDVIANPPFVRLDTGGITTVVVVPERE